MAHVDWSEPTNKTLGPGVYLARVSKCEERTSKKGDIYFNVSLEAVDFDNRLLCYDNINLGGEGRRFGQAKLSALGFDKGRDEIQPEELIGLHAYVSVMNEQGLDGKERRVVVPEWGYGARAGYWAENPGPPPDIAVVTPISPDPQPEPQ